MGGVCLMQLLSESLDILKDEGKTSSDEPYSSIIQYYGNMGRTILTLYLSIVNGLDWGSAVEPLLVVRPLLAFMYCLYIAFAVLCVLNIVTGVFVDNAYRVTANDEDHMVMNELELKERTLNEVREIFESAVPTGKGQMSFDTFQEQIFGNP